MLIGEGFVKSASAKYIKYLNAQQLPITSLKVALQAACLISHFKRASTSSKVRYLATVLSDMDSRRCEIFQVPEKIVDTESNLSSVVFGDLVQGIGLDYLPLYETRNGFIDEKLVYGKNQVAHGELVFFSIDEALERIDSVVALIDQYADQLVGAVRDQQYLAA